MQLDQFFEKLFGVNTKKLLLIIICAPIFTFAASISTNSVTIDNVTNLHFPNALSTPGEVNSSNLSITKGQKYEANITNSDSGFTFYADRSGSHTPVTWTQTQLAVNPDGVVNWTKTNMTSAALKSGYGMPDSLNFALKGDLAFNYKDVNYVCNNIILAQGHSGSHNYWYIFTNMNQTSASTSSKITSSLILNCSVGSSTSAIHSLIYITAKAADTFSVTGIVGAGDQSLPTSNQLCFENMYLQNFTNTTINVTPQENYDNVIEADTTANCLIVYANRQKSADVATWVATQMGQNWEPQNMTTSRSVGSDYVSQLPTKLNFAIKGDLSFIYNGKNYICQNIIFGQGSDGALNDWWGFGNVALNITIPNGHEMSPFNYEISCTSQADGAAATFFLQSLYFSDHMFKLSDQPELDGKPI